MPSDSKFTRDDNGDIAVRVVTQTEQLPASDPDWMFARDTNGNIAIRVVSSNGGGGGDSHNKGWFATQAALEAAYATAEDGDWAIVGETDTVWVWDSDSSGWVDTDSKAEVTPDMVIIKAKVMPAASSTPADAIYQYTGATNATYTTNYIYRNVKTATYTGTVSFEAASLSGTTVACSGDNFAAFLTEAGADPTPIVSGTMTYEADANGWRLVGKDSNNDTVTTFIEYVEDYEDFGFTFTGTPQDGDVVAFTCTVQEASATYAWTRIDVQPAGVTSVNGQTGDVTVSAVPSQTGYSGRVLGTDGFVAGWVEPERVQRDAMPQASEEEVDNIYQYVGTTDANYTNGYFYKCVSDGQNPATYSWETVEVQASSGGLPDQTGQSGKFLTTDGTSASWGTVESLPSQTGQSGKFLTTNGTDASWSDKPLVNNGTGDNSLIIKGDASNVKSAIIIGAYAKWGGSAGQTANSVGIGTSSDIRALGVVGIGTGAYCGKNYTISIGRNARSDAIGAIQFNVSSNITTNSDANTFKVANANGNFEIMSADGTIPAARHAALPAADGTYVLKLVIASGVPTLSWVAE